MRYQTAPRPAESSLVRSLDPLGPEDVHPSLEASSQVGVAHAHRQDPVARPPCAPLERPAVRLPLETDVRRLDAERSRPERLQLDGVLVGVELEPERERFLAEPS